MTERFDALDDGRLAVAHEFVWLLHRHGLDTFEAFYGERAGKLLREVGPRANLRLTLERDGRPVSFFLKRHEPPRARDKLRAWVRLARPKSPARVEWDNIFRLAHLGIATMPPVALGDDPLSGRSFLLTAEIDRALPADEFACEQLSCDVSARGRFARGIGELVRTLHAAGMTHRDLYLCHVFVREVGPDFQLHLIDLQRLGPRLLRRWKVKDVAQLEYSRDPNVLRRADAMRFLHAYFAVGRLSGREKRFVRAVLRKVRRMRRRNRAREVRL